MKEWRDSGVHHAVSSKVPALCTRWQQINSHCLVLASPRAPSAWRRNHAVLFLLTQCYGMVDKRDEREKWRLLPNKEPRLLFKEKKEKIDKKRSFPKDLKGGVNVCWWKIPGEAWKSEVLELHTSIGVSYCLVLWYTAWNIKRETTDK